VLLLCHSHIYLKAALKKSVFMNYQEVIARDISVRFTHPYPFSNKIYQNLRVGYAFTKTNARANINDKSTLS